MNDYKVIYDAILNGKSGGSCEFEQILIGEDEPIGYINPDDESKLYKTLDEMIEACPEGNHVNFNAIYESNQPHSGQLEVIYIEKGPSGNGVSTIDFGFIVPFHIEHQYVYSHQTQFGYYFIIESD